ncbi:MAG: stage II sporulation protein D [Clostridium sp.]
MKKILLFISLIVCLMLGIPIGVVGLGSMKKDIEVTKKVEKAPEAKKKEEVAPTNNTGDIPIKVYYKAQDKVITMNMEEYIKLVVSSEMPASFHEEALKAQSVAARSFLVPKMKVAGGSGCPKAKGADVCSEVHCQAFLPKEERMKKWGAEADSKWRKVSSSVEATRGMVLSYNNEIAKSIKYFSTSGGKTEDSQFVFGHSQPYLRSVESKGEEKAPNFTSVQKVSRSEFVSKVKSKYSDAKLDPKNLEKQIKITDKTVGNRVKNVYIGGKSLTGVEMRSLFSLKSANFAFTFDKDSVIFNVKGYGHGVGMSQWGANEMGKTGKKYNEILTHYYTGIKIDEYKKYIK